MGFPVGYTELMFPKFLLHVVFFLGHLRRLITWAFELFRLADILRDASSDVPTSSDAFSTNVGVASYQSSYNHHRQYVGTANPIFAALIQAALPATTYNSPESDSSSSEETDEGCAACCAVCLHELSSGEEVRRLINCRHVFHRCCLDPWVELDQRTCPLCRTPLVPDRLKDDIDRNLRAAGGPVSDTDGGGGSSSLLSAPSAAASSYFFYDNFDDDGGDLYDESFGFMLPSSQAEPFPWSSTAVPL